MSQNSEGKIWNKDSRAKVISGWMAENTPLNQSVGTYFKGRARKTAQFFLTNFFPWKIATLKAEKMVGQRP